MKIWDVLVIGGGIAGAATAEVLARRGARTLAVEAVTPAHDGGSSHGDGRIIRYTYPEAVYLAMARRAYDAWAAAEEASGETLVERTGSWDCGPADSPAMVELIAGLEAAGIAHERLDKEESERRFPHFLLPEGSIAVYQAEGGIVRAARAVNTLWDLARSAGAETVAGERVVSLKVDGEGVEVESASGTRWRAGTVVVAAGGWSASLLASLGLDLPLNVTREQVVYFPRRAGVEVDCGIGGMPTLIDYHDFEQPFYGLPQIDVPGVKLGWHHSGPEVHPAGGELPGPEVESDLLARCQRFVRERLPLLDPEPVKILRCLYTNTPDYHFILDRHPGLDRVIIGTGFSGHGFKFGPVLGEILADLALGTKPPVDLHTFCIGRFADGTLERRRSA